MKRPAHEREAVPETLVYGNSVYTPLDIHPRRASRTLRAVATACKVGSWPVALMLLMCSCAWMFAGMSWRADLIANLAAQVLVASIVMTTLWTIARWRALALVGLTSALMCLGLLSWGRAAFWPRSVAIARSGVASPEADLKTDVVRVLHYNASTKGKGETIEEFMRAEDADVISIVCPPVLQQFKVVYGPHLSNIYPGKLVRYWKPESNGVDARVTSAFLVSRWPLRDFGPVPEVGVLRENLIAGIVDRPGGPFGVIAVHPISPRTARRWAVGNLVTDTVVEVARQMRDRGLPVVVLADLNSTPTGWRSQRLYAAADLRRAKPLLEAGGTYPDEVPWGLSTRAPRVFPAIWPISIAIDDALISPEIEVLGWTIRARLASEHRPIRIDLGIPRIAPPAPEPGVPAHAS